MQITGLIAQEIGTLGKISNLDLKLLNGKKTSVYLTANLSNSVKSILLSIILN